MDDPVTDDLSRMKNGSLDVKSELEFISRFSELGMDTEGMEDLLFTDIERYKLRKKQLLHAEIHGQYEMDHLEEEDQYEPSFQGEDDIIIDHEDPLMDEEGIVVEDDLLLLGHPLRNGETDEEFDTIVIDREKEQTQQLPPAPITTEDVQTIPEKSTTDDINDIKPEDQVASDQIEDEQHLDRSSNLKGDRRILIGVVSLSIIFLLIGSYFLYNLVDDGGGTTSRIDPAIQVSDINPEAGDLIVITGSPLEDDIVYKWEINPSAYSYHSGGPDSSESTIFFKKAGLFEIKLEVERGTRTESTYISIDVEIKSITLERESYGDSAEYDVEGHVRFDRIYNVVDSSDMRAYSVLDADFWTPDFEPMVTTISENSVQARNGLGKTYSHMERNSRQTLKISGYLEPDVGKRTTLTGETILDQNSYTDIYTKRPTSLQSDVTYDLSFQTLPGTPIDYVANEKVWTYPSLSDSFSDLRIEDISPERHISISDSGTTTWGSYDLQWTAVEYSRIMDTPSLKLDLSLDSASMNRLSISSLSLQIWIGDTIPQIMKMVMNTSSMRTVQTPYILDYSQIMTGHSKGNDPVIFGDISYEHDHHDSIDDIEPDLAGEFHSNWEMVPKIGSKFTSIPSDFTAEDAVELMSNNPNYKNFERTLSDPIAIYTNFSVKLGKDQWKLSIAEENEDRAWNQTVFREASSFGLASKVDPVRLSREDIGTILTYSGAEVSLKRIIGSVNSEAAKMVFGVSDVEDTREIDTGKFFIGTEVDMDYPALGLVNPTLSERIDYGMFIISTNGNLEIGFDMKSGQLSYVRMVS